MGVRSWLLTIMNGVRGWLLTIMNGGKGLATVQTDMNGVRDWLLYRLGRFCDIPLKLDVLAALALMTD